MADWGYPYVGDYLYTTVQGSSQATTLNMTDEEKQAASERERPPVGFSGSTQGEGLMPKLHPYVHQNNAAALAEGSAHYQAELESAIALVTPGIVSAWHRRREGSAPMTRSERKRRVR